MHFDHVAFTGSRKGMTHAQEEVVLDLLALFAPIAVHHGNCVGADATFHTFVVEHQLTVRDAFLYPSDIPKMQANCQIHARPKLKIHVASPKKPLVRNVDIVRAGEVLIATPKELTEAKKGGTWATIKDARRANKPRVIVFPDGHVDHEQTLMGLQVELLYETKPECPRESEGEVRS